MLGATVHTRIVGLQLVPERLELVHGVGAVRELGEDRADCHDDGEVIHHVASELRTVDVVVYVIGLHHHASNTPIVVDAAGEHLLVNRLVFAADVITIQVNVEVVEAVAKREGHVGVDVVYVEGVSGHLELGRAQGFGAVGQRVHKQVLAHLEMADLPPGKDLAHGEHATVVDDVARVVLDVLVDIVGDDEVDLLVHVDKATKLSQKCFERVGIRPVIGIDVLEIGAVGVLDGLHDGNAVPAVLLVNGLDKAGIALLPFIGLCRSVVLCTAVVDDDDLNVVGVIRALENREDALVHVFGRVIAGNAERDGLLCGCHGSRP